MIDGHGTEVECQAHAGVCENKAGGWRWLRTRQAQRLERPTHPKVDMHHHRAVAFSKEVEKVFAMNLNPCQWLPIQGHSTWKKKECHSEAFKFNTHLAGACLLLIDEASLHAYTRSEFVVFVTKF